MVTDPPAGVSFMQANWDSDKGGRDQWIAWLSDVMSECIRALKPGGHALVWSLPRTSHWTGMALERAGFEVRDCITHFKDRSPALRAFLDSLTPEQEELLARAEPSSGMMAHVFGSGFPKSLDVSKGIDKAAGAERATVGTHYRHGGGSASSLSMSGSLGTASALPLTAPATDAAKAWQGWGTTLKPAAENWWLVRKSLSGPVAQNVIQHGTGAINVDGCRIGTDGGGTNCSNRDSHGKCQGHRNAGRSTSGETFHGPNGSIIGRWPANVLLSHGDGCRVVEARTIRRAAGPGWNGLGGDNARHVYGKGWTPDGVSRQSTARTETVEAWECAEGCPVAELDRQSGTSKSSGGAGEASRGALGKNTFGKYALDRHGANAGGFGDSGGASRYFNTFEPEHEAPFFYSAKPSTRERDAGLSDLPVKDGHEVCDREEGSAGAENPRAGARTPRRNIHPTVKGQALMRHLVRLVTPPGGIVLDPFAGSGSTLVAAITEGFRCIGIEREDEYIEIARRRVEHASSLPVDAKTSKPKKKSAVDVKKDVHTVETSPSKESSLQLDLWSSTESKASS